MFYQKKSQLCGILLGFFIATTVMACEKHQKLAAEEINASSPVKVLEFVLTTGIEGREPMNRVEQFQLTDNKGYIFARLSSTSAENVSFVWLKGGKEVSSFSTNVHAAKQWRTFSSVKLGPGQWTVELRLGKQVLASQSFRVGA